MFNNPLPVKYQWMDIEKDQGAGNCIECGECEPKCPQKISIIEDLKKVNAEMQNL